MTWGLFPVYCKTSPAWCCDDSIFLGYHPPGVKVKCYICGRFTTVERNDKDGGKVNPEQAQFNQDNLP